MPFPLVDITVVPDDEIVQHRRVALLELMQKPIRQRDLLGIVEHLTAILLSGYANDRQLKTLFNYLIHSGKALRLGKFIREVGRRQGKREGRLEGVEEGQRAEALRIAQTMVAEGMALETVLRITGLSEADIRAVIH